MILLTDRLLLREFNENDWPNVLTYQSDQQYLRYYHWTQRTEEDVSSFIRSFISQQNEEPRTKFQLAMILRSEEKLIGNGGIRKKNHNSIEAEIGYELDLNYWGNGYATEAANTLLQFGFQELMLHRISSYCVADNKASAHVLEKIGMKYEGRLRENVWIKGGWMDTLLYAILESEWKK
jgi:RimJ/RimL family protein N-acetyltransferase